MARGRRQPEEFGEGDDVYSVERTGPGEFLVRHFPDPVTRRACCKIKVTVRPGDHPPGRTREEIEADPRGEIAALRRADLAIAKKHAGIVDNKSTA